MVDTSKFHLKEEGKNAIIRDGSMGVSLNALMIICEDSWLIK